MFDRFMFSADLGDGAGGGADLGGGADAGAALDQGAAGGEAQPFDYESFAQQHGGPEGLQKIVKEHGEIANRYKYDPQFRSTFEKALRGEYGPQAQQQAQQQQAQQGGQQGQPQGQQQQPAFKYEPQTLAQMQTFYRLLEQAKESGDPEAVQRVYNDPQNAKAKEAYLAHQDQMNNAWWDQRGHFQKMIQDPEHQQLFQQQFQQFAEPLQQEMQHGLKEIWYEANQQAVDSLPQQVRQALESGFYGELHGSFQEWKKAVRGAIEDAKKFAVAGNATATQNPKQNADATATERRMNNGPAKNGLKGKEDDGMDGAGEYRKMAEQMAKAKLAKKS